VDELSKNETQDSVIGQKNDDDKPDWSLMPAGIIRQLVKVLTFGANKYAINNWKHVKDAENRYYAAAIRHIEEWREGRLNDDESGLHHLAHAICCLIFLIWFDDNKKQKAIDKAGA